MFSVSKVNDYMPTPLHLSCFCETCCQNSTNEDEIKPAHSYQLFAVIMHLGITMASGHYVSYVKANDNIVDYCHCEKNNTGSGNNSSSSSGGGILKFLKSKTDNIKISSLGANVCRSSDCCGIRLSVDQGIDFSVPEQAWLECDDENVNILTTSEFEDVLSKNHTKHSSLTPYLLFYVRSPP
jgi:ubiquitin carboxyl-terminal hydrolase 1